MGVPALLGLCSAVGPRASCFGSLGLSVCLWKGHLLNKHSQVTSQAPETCPLLSPTPCSHLEQRGSVPDPGDRDQGQSQLSRILPGGRGQGRSVVGWPPSQGSPPVGAALKAQQQCPVVVATAISPWFLSFSLRPRHHAGSGDSRGGVGGSVPAAAREARPGSTRTPSASGAGRGLTKEMLLEDKERIPGRAKSKGSRAGLQIRGATWK